MPNDVASLNKLLADALADEKRLVGAREQIEGELAKAREKVDLLQRLLGLSSDVKLESTPPVRKPSTKPPPHAPQRDARMQFEDYVQRILETAREPVHISKIRQALVDGGVVLPGRGHEANIIVRLARDPERFVRTGRGTYGLKALGASEVRPTKVRRVKGARRQEGT